MEMKLAPGEEIREPVSNTDIEERHLEAGGRGAGAGEDRPARAPLATESLKWRIDSE
jgi:hypothetical protein